MPRYALLEHDHPVLHWDFMLECGGVLRTWRLDAIPDASAVISAEPLPDHRLAYLDYEGPVSGDRGTVRRVDRGAYDVVQEAHDLLEVELRGHRLQGRATISSDRFQWIPRVADCV